MSFWVSPTDCKMSTTYVVITMLAKSSLAWIKKSSSTKTRTRPFENSGVETRTKHQYDGLVKVWLRLRSLVCDTA